MAREGRVVCLGGHGQLQGLGPHGELWAFVLGGMTPQEALRMGTLASTRALGLDRDLGSLEPGKLADLVVLDDNPLDRIDATVMVSLIVKAGVAYRPDELARVESGSCCPHLARIAARPGTTMSCSSLRTARRIALALWIASGVFQAWAQVPHHLVGEGLGDPSPNRVRVFTASGAPTSTDFQAYAAGRWGVNVAAAEIDGGTSELLTGPGPGTVFGPQVRAFRETGSPLGKVSFYAYGTLKYGVNVSGGSLDADAPAEILSGAGPGAVFGPHVRGFNFDGAAVAAIAKVSFFAYGTLRYGVNVAAGGTDTDAFDEILTGPGPSAAFGPQVRGFDYDGAALRPIAAINFNACGTGYGVNVAAGDVNAAGVDGIVSAAGPGPASAGLICGYDVGGGVTPLPGFAVTPFGTLSGARASTHPVGGAPGADLLAGAGRDPSASAAVKDYQYQGAVLSQLSGSFDAFPGSGYGVNVAGVDLPPSGSGHVVYGAGSRVYRIEAVTGALPEDISLRLDVLSPGADAAINQSPDGQWLLVTTERFHPQCVGWPCLALVDGSVTSGSVVLSGGQVVHPAESSAVASGGDLIVYPDGGGPHTRDLWALRRSGGTFGAPQLLTGAVPYAWSLQPAISDDSTRLVFDCGDQPYGGPGTAVCEVMADGTGLRVVRTPAQSPPGYPPGVALHHPDYAPDGSIVFEGDWSGERVWRLLVGAADPVLLGVYGDDNSPCVLPDGRVVSLWLGRPGGSGLHEIKAMDATGATYVMLLTGTDVADIGLGCGR